MLSKDDVKTIFEDNLKAQPWWSKLMGSQFAIGIINFIYQVVYRCLSLAHRELAEAFISLAIRPSSILAAAEGRGYVRAKITPSLGDVDITNDGATSLFIPALSVLNSQGGLGYITSVSVSIPAGGTVAIEAKQLVKKRISTAVSSERDYLEILLDSDDSAKAHKVDVLIDDGVSITQWNKSYLFRNGVAATLHYVEFYTPTEQLGIRFGNGVIGKRPPAGSTVHLDIWLTEGETTLIAGQPLFFVDAAYAETTVATATPIVGGEPQESIESVRQGALYSPAFNGDAVWGADYRSFIAKKLPTIEWISVWGEQEQEAETGFDIQNSNKVFICAYSKLFTQSQLQQQIADLFTDKSLLNLSLSFVDVNLVPIDITINGTIEPRDGIADITARLTAAIDANYGVNAPIKTNSDGDLVEMKVKDLWRFVDQQNLLVDFDLSVAQLVTARALAEFRYIDTEISTLNVHR